MPVFHLKPYTAIDEYSRWRYVEAFEEHSTYSSSVFVEHLIRHFPMSIECVQTDNGAEFTKRFTQPGKETLTMFQRTLRNNDICHKLIKPFTPRHNGKVERSHRKDNERFYATHKFYSFEDFSKQLQRYNYRDYNRFPMRPLEWKYFKTFHPSSQWTWRCRMKSWGGHRRKPLKIPGRVLF